MAARLVAEEGSLKGIVLSLEDGDQWVIGRDPDACQLLVEDPLASRKHLICRASPEGIIAENLSTTNPLQINEEEVKEPRLLLNGDTVKIGGSTFRFYSEAAAQLIKDKETSEDTTSPSENKSQEKMPGEEEHPSPPVNNVEINNVETPKPNEQKPMEVSQEETAETEKKTSSLASPMAPPVIQPQELATDEEERHDSIFDEEPSDKHGLAEINFGLLETGRWLLKVIGGPNNGAEFSMQAGSSYVIGTDPNACDIVFHDTSVSRQHARITVSQDDKLIIEDLKSRNGTIVDGEPLKGKQPLNTNTLVSVGTTSFIVFDREGEMQTIISPLMPSIVKVLQTEEPPKAEETPEGSSLQTQPLLADQKKEAAEDRRHHAMTLGAFILIGILTGLFVIVGIGTTTLFKSEPIVQQQTVDPSAALDKILSSFPSVKYTFNKNTGQLLLVGHVLTSSDRSQLLYALRGLPFIKSLDEGGIVIDEYVWRETNQILENNPEWQGITVMATSPGHYVVSGYLNTRAQADRLTEYLNANFAYPDLLEKRVVVAQDITSAINSLLQNKGLKNVTAKIDNGDISLTGTVPIGKEPDVGALVEGIKSIPGVRNVSNLTVEQAPEASFVNITNQYPVTGISKEGGNTSVVINGRILMKGDILDGMTITKITPLAVYLEKGNTQYRIDYSR